MVSFSSVPCFCLHASCKAASFGDVHSSDPRACFFELLLFFIGRSPFCTSSALFTGSVPQKYNPAGDRASHLISDFRCRQRAGVTITPRHGQSGTLSNYLWCTVLVPRARRFSRLTLAVLCAHV